MATSPSDLVTNTYMTSRHPNFSGTTGSIVSAPFVLHKNLLLQTLASGPTNVSDQPWGVYNGLFTELAGSISAIVPISVPAEYAILETWMVAKTGTYATADTPAIINIYGSTPIGQNNKGNLPGDLNTIANWPTEVNRWWTPLSSVDRTAPGTTGTADGEMYTGIDSSPAASGSVHKESSTGQYPMQAFNCQVLTKPIPATDGEDADSQIPVSTLGTATASLDCYPSTQWYLNGSDIVMVTVKTAAVDAAGTDLSDCMLMGRLHG
jgi:hypothetical protein